MDTTIVKFYNDYGQVYNQQNIDIPAEFIVSDLSLKELADVGITVPTLPDVSNKSFLGWIKQPTKNDESESTIVYTFYPRYISSSLGTEYCDNQLDELDDKINGHDNNLNIHIDEQNNKINNADTTIGKLQNIDGDIIDEIKIVKEGYERNKQKILLLNNYNYDEQFSYLYSDIQRVQNEINEMEVNHNRDLLELAQRLNKAENIMVNLQNKALSIPKHYIISQNAYRNIESKDKNAIYFTKEN